MLVRTSWPAADISAVTAWAALSALRLGSRRPVMSSWRRMSWHNYWSPIEIKFKVWMLIYKCSSDVDQQKPEQIKSDLNMFFQSWVHVDRVLFNVVNNRAVGDIVILAGSSIPTEEEEDHDDNQRHKGGSADESQDGCHVALNLTS